MTKTEAIESMLSGQRVRHQYFLPEEYIYMESGRIFDENDRELFGFWEHRTIEDWNDNWSVSRVWLEEKQQNIIASRF